MKSSNFMTRLAMFTSSEDFYKSTKWEKMSDDRLAKLPAPA